MRPSRKPTLGPRYDLALVQAAEIVMRRSVVERANEVLETDEKHARKVITALIRELQPDDFVQVTHFGRPVVIADVYGRRDELCLWYVKFYLVDEYESSKTVVASCHPAEHDIQLASGKILRRFSR